MNFSDPQTAECNGITMEYFEAGAGPVVLLLHGFPEHPFSWRKQIGAIVAAGFRVVAPSQRGFGGTSAPADVRTYTVRNLVADLCGLLDALEVERAVWLGHDWGSMPAWYAGVYARERVIALGSLCTPYVRWRGAGDPLEHLARTRGPSNYMLTFQTPGVAERILERNVEHTFRALLRGRGYTMDEFELAPVEVRELPIGVFVGEPQLFGPPIVTDEELRFYVDVYRRTGFTGGLNWYRALPWNHADTDGVDHRIEVPALMITAADDWFFPRGSTDGLSRLVPRVERHLVADAAHWVQQEKPDEVNAIIISWLRRTVGVAHRSAPVLSGG